VSYPDDVPTLTDGVVTLRAHRPDDVDAVVEQGSDPVSLRWTTVPSPYHREHAEDFVGRVIPQGWDDGSAWRFAVEARDDDGTPRYCGTIELRDEGSDRAEVAYGAHPWARGRGIVRRGLELLLSWGFEERGLRTVIWWANRGNWASRRTAWRSRWRTSRTRTMRAVVSTDGGRKTTSRTVPTWRPASQTSVPGMTPRALGTAA